MQAQLIRLIDDRTRMLAAMSHDLKTPITRMRLRTDLLDDDELRARFEKDLREMEAMVSETLDFMRGLNASEPRQPIDMAALADSIAEDTRELGHQVEVSGLPAQPYLGVNRLLRRCLSNLIDNAVSYGGGAGVTFSDSPTELTVRVTDHGPGLAADEVEKVFDPFYRCESSRSRDTGGTGLGLSIARTIAEYHGGSVRLSNRSGGGLEATLTLPRSVAN